MNEGKQYELLIDRGAPVKVLRFENGQVHVVKEQSEKS